MKELNCTARFVINYLTHDIISSDERRKVRKAIQEALANTSAKDAGSGTHLSTGEDYPSLKGRFLKHAEGYSKDAPLVFTSCTNNYIPKARVLASSFKKMHPDWEFRLLLGEAPPEGFNMDDEPFDSLVLFEDLDIPGYWQWLFRHRVVEICTAAKGHALHHFTVREQRSKVFYIDPDIMVFNSLQPLSDLLDEHDILLTPHLLAPADSSNDRAIKDNELCTLMHGTYNLGFVAVNAKPDGQGVKFATWWRDRLHKYCYDDIPNGIFTDQRWCDLAPSFFSKACIIRDPGYNAASWNLSDREITRRPDGAYMANGNLLRFYHFTGYDSGAGERMADRYGKGMPAVQELWKEYADLLESYGHGELKKYRWTYMDFSDGIPVTDEMRMLFRNAAASELAERFANPYSISSEENFRLWYSRRNA